MQINFPSATADNQIFKFGDLSWTWSSVKNRWESTPLNTQTFFPISSGGTNSNVSSGALIELGVTKENLGINFATLNHMVSGVNSDLFVSSLLAVQAILTPGFRFIPVVYMNAATGAGTSNSFSSNFLGGQVNFPTTVGFSSRTLGGSGQVMLSRGSGLFGRINWNNTVMLAGRLRGGAAGFVNDTRIFYWVFGEVTTDPVTGQFVNDRKAIGIRIAGKGPIELITQNGSTASFTALSSNYSDLRGTPVDFMIMNRAGNTSLYLNSTFSVSTSSGPTGVTTSTGNTRLRISAESLTDDVLNTVYVSGTTIYVE